MKTDYSNPMYNNLFHTVDNNLLNKLSLLGSFFKRDLNFLGYIIGSSYYSIQPIVMNKDIKMLCYSVLDTEYEILNEHRAIFLNEHTIFAELEMEIKNEIRKTSQAKI